MSARVRSTSVLWQKQDRTPLQYRSSYLSSHPLRIPPEHGFALPSRWQRLVFAQLGLCTSPTWLPKTISVCSSHMQLRFEKIDTYTVSSTRESQNTPVPGSKRHRKRSLCPYRRSAESQPSKSFYNVLTQATFPPILSGSPPSFFAALLPCP